jgi:ADP-ribosylglycohydrolase
MMLGLALGDALGRPLEFLSLDEIRGRYGETALADPDEPLRSTDDTSMTVAVAEALVAAGADEPDALMSAVVERFVRWRNEVKPEDSPGNTCLEATARLEAGVPWTESGVSWSKGAGAVMRTAPVGFFYAGYPVLLREVTRMIAATTHGHPTAWAAANVVSVCVKEALDETDPAFWIDRSIQFLSGTSCGEVIDALRRIPDAVTARTDEEAMASLGEGWIAEEAVAMALAAVLRHRDDFGQAVRCAVRHGGDSDTVGCVTGALMGARLGERDLPEKLLERLEGADRLRALAVKMAAGRDRMR